jgi:transcriptional regulator with XRE-family HTH domain
MLGLVSMIIEIILLSMRREQAVDQLDQQIACRVKARRQALGLTLDQLAEISGVSRAMISRIERGEASPTAVLLCRVAGGLGMTLSALLATPADAEPLVRASERAQWKDPATGYVRRAVSPTTAPMDIVDVSLPPGARVAYDNVAPLPITQLVWVLNGDLRLTADGATHDLGDGDCLLMRLDRPIVYENTTQKNVRYAVVLHTAALKEGPLT